MDEFLNPKSMLTPGAAGGVMMLIANTISSYFPEIPFRYSALALSFLIGTMVFQAKNILLFQRCTFWVLNSLLIFAVGVGTSNIAHNVTAQSDTTALLEQLSPISRAYADTPAELAAENARLKAELMELKRSIEHEQRLTNPSVEVLENTSASDTSSDSEDNPAVEQSGVTTESSTQVQKSFFQTW